MIMHAILTIIGAAGLMTFLLLWAACWVAALIITTFLVDEGQATLF